MVSPSIPKPPTFRRCRRLILVSWKSAQAEGEVEGFMRIILLFLIGPVKHAAKLWEGARAPKL
jgi:hypothetical protein